MIDVSLDKNWRVRLTACFRIPSNRETVWKIISDVPRFVCTDHFHKRVNLVNERFGLGAKFTIEHRFLLFRVLRQARILQWRSGFGYSYSDLSMRRPQTGFPHVFFLDLTDNGSACLVRVRVNGRWTLNILGRFLTHVWLRWNLIALKQGIENAILTSLVLDQTREKKNRS